MADKLRILKINPADDRVPSMTEFVLVPVRDIPGKFKTKTQVLLFQNSWILL